MRSFIFTLAMLSSVSSVYSQEKQVNFRTLAIAQFEFPELWVLKSGKPVSITFSKAQPSSPFKADRTKTLSIYKGPLGEDSKPTDTSPISVDLPTSSSILLLGWMTDEMPEFLAIEDFYTKLKAEDWRIINASKSEISIQIGKDADPITINASSDKSVKITDLDKKGSATSVVSALQADGSQKTIYTGIWPILNDSRGLIVVAQNGERLTVNFIADQITKD